MMPKHKKMLKDFDHTRQMTDEEHVDFLLRKKGFKNVEIKNE